MCSLFSVANVDSNHRANLSWLFIFFRNGSKSSIHQDKAFHITRRALEAAFCILIDSSSFASSLSALVVTTMTEVLSKNWKLHIAE